MRTMTAKLRLAVAASAVAAGLVLGVAAPAGAIIIIDGNVAIGSPDLRVVGNPDLIGDPNIRVAVSSDLVVGASRG